MNEKKIKELYAAHAENTAPDMDALWKRIESGLEEKDSAGVTSKPVKRKISLKKAFITVAAAAAGVLLILPAAVQNGQSSNMATGDAGYAQTASEVPETIEHADTEAFYDSVENISYETSAQNSAVLYESLDLAPAEDLGVAPKNKPAGDDFFVEANVLIQTEFIVNAYVDKVYSSGGTVCYELTAENAETHVVDSITVESATPYVMLENRSYLLPLKSGDGSVYSLAFENAPQIELTLDGGMIFHNGWECLSDGNEADVIYPQGSVDDFFYDRMKFSYTADIQTLVKKWREINGDD